jgi:hypothetical protein
LSDGEKKQIIMQRYGNQVLQEYVKNAATTNMQKSAMTQLQANALAHNLPVRKEQTVTVNKVTGKKKI